MLRFHNFNVFIIFRFYPRVRGMVCSLCKRIVLKYAWQALHNYRNNRIAFYSLFSISYLYPPTISILYQYLLFVNTSFCNFIHLFIIVS